MISVLPWIVGLVVVHRNAVSHHLLRTSSARAQPKQYTINGHDRQPDHLK